MGWWVLTFLENFRTLHHLNVLAGTNRPTHLTMAWARHAPARQAVYRTVRGKRVFCGWKYIWDTPNLTEQLQPGTTYDHTFGPLSLASMDHVWYVLHSPGIAPGTFCQSPLIHVWPPELHAWTTKMYVGTQLKGIYYTDSFTGPGGLHPTWTTLNEGLHSELIFQLEPDPFGPSYRMYALAGAPGDRTLYVRTPSLTPSWLELLTNAAALALTGSASGELRWVATNAYFPGYLYVLFNSALFDTGFWCIRSLDYGQTWTAHAIPHGLYNYAAGNISVGLSQGASPYAPGTVLYAALDRWTIDPATLWLSIDHGQTWTMKDGKGVGLMTPRCLVDPTDQSTVYIGAYTGGANIHELFRSETHGAALTQVDGAHHLGLMLGPFTVNLWINPTDRAFLTALSGNHLFVSLDYSTTWADQGLIAETVARFALLWENPDRFYLARHVSGSPGPPYSNCHVIFASEDYGATMYGKSGANACLPTGGADSIPYNCGGICRQGIQLFPPY